MARKINKEDIRVGDKIRVVISQEITVGEIYDGVFKGEDGSVVYLNGTDPWTRSFELIHRPTPDLPNAPGSVVRVSRGGHHTHWLLHRGDYWVSASGIKKYAPDLIRFVEGSGMTLEVIA